MYCTYLTIYSGTKFPQLYIGHSSISKVLKGYHGSVRSHQFRKIWESELTENPQLFRSYILSEYETREEAIEMEEFIQRHCCVLDFTDRYLNRCIANKDFHLSEEGKAKISEKAKRRKMSPEAIRKTALFNTGKHHSKEHCLKISKGMTGRIVSEETRNLLSQKLKNRKFSPETIEKMRLGQLGKKKSLETKAKLKEIWNRRKLNIHA